MLALGRGALLAGLLLAGLEASNRNSVPQLGQDLRGQVPGKSQGGLRFLGHLQHLPGEGGGHGHAAVARDGSADQEIEVLDDDLWGFYAYLDRAWDQYNSAGVQLSWHEAPEAGTPEVSELDVYYTRMLSEFQRLRLGATVADHEDQGESYRLMIQYTAFIGPHGHGINW